MLTAPVGQQGSAKREPLRLFVCEFITGGGVVDGTLPSALTTEGGAMLRALLADLGGLGYLNLTTTRDWRLAPLDLPVTCLKVSSRAAVWTLWKRCIQGADLVWPVAPETGGVLERLSRLVLEAGRMLIGCHPEAIRATASKYRTAEVLRRSGIAVPETRWAGTGIPDSTSGWVVKPDDGAGCEETWYFSDRRELEGWLSGEGARGAVVQPYIPGVPASLSLLCYDNKVELLACNRQHIEIRGKALSAKGVSVGALRCWRAPLLSLADGIAGALRGLRGYVGVDLVLGDDGPVVIEVNPRLTTAYVGLTEVLGGNAAGWILRALGIDGSGAQHRGTGLQRPP